GNSSTSAHTSRESLYYALLAPGDLYATLHDWRSTSWNHPRCKTMRADHSDDKVTICHPTMEIGTQNCSVQDTGIRQYARMDKSAEAVAKVLYILAMGHARPHRYSKVITIRYSKMESSPPSHGITNLPSADPIVPAVLPPSPVPSLFAPPAPCTELAVPTAVVSVPEGVVAPESAVSPPAQPSALSDDHSVDTPATKTPDALTTNSKIQPADTLEADPTDPLSSGTSTHSTVVASDVAASSAGLPSPDSSTSSPAIVRTVSGWVIPDVHLARAFMGDDYWGIVDSVISDETSRAFRNWDEPVPAVAVHLQDWMYKTGYIDYEDIMLLGSDDDEQ
ncbi:hypothetical protein BZA77DRAFT_377089, partial [Pyronema omphalodes]